MNPWTNFLEQIRERSAVFVQMFRAHALGMRGARVSRKVRIGPKVRSENPWGISLGERAHIEHNVYLKLVSARAKLTVGSYTFIGQGSELDVDKSVSLGSHTLVAPGCFITDHHHEIEAGHRIDQQTCRTQPVRIGNDVWLGANSVILAGVTIGDGAVIGAGAVVTRDVAEMDIVAGVPARRIGNRRDSTTKATGG